MGNDSATCVSLLTPISVVGLICRAFTPAIISLSRVKGAKKAIISKVNIDNSNKEEKKIEISRNPNHYGIYIPSDRRFLFTFITSARGVEKEEVRKENPDLFDKVYIEVLLNIMS